MWVSSQSKTIITKGKNVKVIYSRCLAKTTTRSLFVLITYIVKSTKNQKGQTEKNDLPY